MAMLSRNPTSLDLYYVFIDNLIIEILLKPTHNWKEFYDTCFVFNLN